jgi:type II secretion system protein J
MPARPVKYRLRQHSGFTLIELLLAVAIFGVVMLATYGAVDHATRVRSAVVARADMLKAAESFLQRLDREIGAAYVVVPSPATAVASAEGVATVFRALNHEEAVPRDALVFTCNCGEVWTYGMVDSNRTPHTEVSYDFVYDEDSRQTLLMRREDTTPDSDPLTGGLVDSLWPVLRGLNLRFLDPLDGSWRDDWDSSARPPQAPLPQAVEITLWLAQPEGDVGTIENPLILGYTIVLPGVRKAGNGQ